MPPQRARRAPRPSLDRGRKGLLQEALLNFCASTNLHGYKFLASKDSSPLDRDVWSTIVTASLLSVAVVLYFGYLETTRDHAAIFTESTHNMVWQYPFTALTICPHNQLSRRGVEDFVKTLKTNISQERLTKDMKTLFQLITLNNDFVSQRKVDRLQNVFEENRVNVSKLLEKLSPKCDQILKRCLWHGNPRRCSELFRPLKTLYGSCCAFNYYGIVRKLESAFLRGGREIEKTGGAPGPRMLSECGPRTALEVSTGTEPGDYFATQIPSVGHLLLVHSPFEQPHFVPSTFPISSGFIYAIGVTPTLTYATEEVRDLRIEDRDCAFSDEIRLAHFRKYSNSNCRTECRMNVTKKRCGCIPFYYREDGMKMRMCGLKDLVCLKKNYYRLSSSTDRHIHYEKNDTDLQCKCIPDCETNTYSTRMSETILSRRYSANSFGLRANLNTGNSTLIRLFYTDMFGEKNRNDVHYDFDMRFAFYGGILGLFLGFNLVTVCEIFYFLFIRVLVEALKRRNSNRISARSHCILKIVQNRT